MTDDYGSGGTGDAGHVVMFGQPKAMITPGLGVSRQVGRYIDAASIAAVAWAALALPARPINCLQCEGFHESIHPSVFRRCPFTIGG